MLSSELFQIFALGCDTPQSACFFLPITKLTQADQLRYRDLNSRGLQLSELG